jgi:hypothetical protein
MGTRTVGSVFCASAVTLAVLLAGDAARADRHTGDVGGGIGGGRRSFLLTGNLEGDVVVPEWPCRRDLRTGKHRCTLSVASAISLAQGDHEGLPLRQFQYQLGLRYTWNPPLDYRLQPFVVALGGGTYKKLQEGGNFGSASIGIGADYVVSREPHPCWVLRFQVAASWINDGSGKEWYPQAGVSVIYRFEKDLAGSKAAGKQ